MPRYFFHFRYGQKLFKERQGTVLPDQAAARRELLLIARDFVDRTTGQLRPAWEGWWIAVHNWRGDQVLSMPLAIAGPEGFTGRRPSGARVIEGGAQDSSGQVLFLRPVGGSARSPRSERST